MDEEKIVKKNVKDFFEYRKECDIALANHDINGVKVYKSKLQALSRILWYIKMEKEE